jgi:saccharopine dehydrogenase (NAD+, L-lysine-forming)
MLSKLGIVRETKNKWERRAPITPDDLKELISQYSVEVAIQPSKKRIFSDNAYKAAGAIVQDDLSSCDIILGIKEVKIKDLMADKLYLYFSHTIKGQSYNMSMLRRLIDLKCTLLDYERIVDEKGQRQIFYGYHAGVAGLIDTLWAFGRRLDKEGIYSPFSILKQSLFYTDQSEATASLVKVGDQIRANGLPAAITPLVVGITGYGNVSRGIQDMLNFLPVTKVDPDHLKEINMNSHTLYMSIFEEKDMVESVSGSTTFDLEEYYNYPKRYRSKFGTYLNYISILINASFWDTAYPRHVTKENLKELFSGIKKPALRVIGDISCDVNGGIECTVKATDPGDPVFVYKPDTDMVLDGFSDEGLVIMAVDNLPSELPKDASIYFSSVLKTYIPALVTTDFLVGFNSLDLPYALKKAIIVYKGELTDDYLYLKEYL